MILLNFNACELNLHCANKTEDVSVTLVIQFNITGACLHPVGWFILFTGCILFLKPSYTRHSFMPTISAGMSWVTNSIGAGTREELALITITYMTITS